MTNDNPTPPAPSLPQEVRKAIEDILEAEYGRASSPVVTQSIFKAIAPHWPVPSDMNYFRQRMIESEERVENAVKLLAAASEDTKRLDWMDEYEAEVQKYEESEDGSKRYEVWFFVGSDPSPVFSAPNLREAIDAARNSCKRKSLRR